MLPAVVEQQPPDLVRVEKSLHSLGFFCASKNKEHSRTVKQVIRRPDGQRMQAKAVISGLPELGLPTTADRDKYMAFMKVVLDQKARHGEVCNPIRFSAYSLLKLLRLSFAGFHYDEINDWLKRMVATTIMSESIVFLADRKEYASKIFHVFDQVILFGEERADGSRAEQYEVWLSQWQLNNINASYLLPLDFNAYLELRKEISKALFGHLHVWFYASRGRAVEKNYAELCDLLHIRAYPHLSKAKEVLRPSLDELMRIGYLSSWDLTKTVGGDGMKLIMSPGPRLLSTPALNQAVQAEARAVLEAPPPPWVAELVKRGVAERAARLLVKDVPSSQNVMEQIEWGDHIVATSAKGKLRNPPGLFLWIVQNNVQPPPEFETARRRELREQRLSSEQTDYYQKLQLELDYEAFRRQAIDRALAEQYPADALDTAVVQAVHRVLQDYPTANRMTAAQRRELALQLLRRDVEKSLCLPTLDEFAKSASQMTMAF